MRSPQDRRSRHVAEEPRSYAADVSAHHNVSETRESDGLSVQMRWAAVSVSANIAEGYMKRGRADKARYLNTAQGSLEELRDLLLAVT